MTNEIEGQMSIFDFLGPDLWYGKMSPEPSVPTVEKTSERSLKKPQKWLKGMPAYLSLMEDGHKQDASWEMGGPLLGEFTMHSFGELPSVENVSLLSQILEDRPHPKYSLSARACMGILRRAEKRGKELPELLKAALLKQSASLNEPDVMGGAREYLSNMNEQQPCPPSTTNQSLECLKDDRGGQEPYTASKASFFLRSHNDGVADVLVATDYKDPPITCYGIDRASFNQGQNALYDFSVEEEKAQTIVARGPGGVLAKQLERYVQEITKE